MKKRKMSNLWGITAIILLIGSILLLLYPTASKVINQITANATINRFNQAVDVISENVHVDDTNNQPSESRSNTETYTKKNNQITDYNNQIVTTSEYSISVQDIEALYRDSQRYNDRLKQQQSFDEVDFSVSALNLYDYGIYNGIYGYISIPHIDLQMPILLGSSRNNMAVGVTHLYATSLPLGGKDTNCVLSGHTGATGKIFFDDIPSLPIGSVITVTTFFGSLNYQVNEIKKIDITQTNDLFIEKGRDKLTLLTCADGGIRRWQVSCTRIGG